MPHDAHTATHDLIESVAAVVLIAAGLVVLGLMARRRRLGLTTSVVLAPQGPGSTRRFVRSVAVVPAIALPLLLAFLAVVRLASAAPA
jgi:hypothetical protein